MEGERKEGATKEGEGKEEAPKEACRVNSHSFETRQIA